MKWCRKRSVFWVALALFVSTVLAPGTGSAYRALGNPIPVDRGDPDEPGGHVMNPGFDPVILIFVPGLGPVVFQFSALVRMLRAS